LRSHISALGRGDLFCFEAFLELKIFEVFNDLLLGYAKGFYLRSNLFHLIVLDLPFKAE